MKYKNLKKNFKNFDDKSNLEIKMKKLLKTIKKTIMKNYKIKPKTTKIYKYFNCTSLS